MGSGLLHKLNRDTLSFATKLNFVRSVPCVAVLDRKESTGCRLDCKNVSLVLVLPQSQDMTSC